MTQDVDMTCVVVLDVESTGKEKATDQIIEICLRLGLGADDQSHVWRIRPSIPIHAEATAVHGITDADLAECPTFAEVIPQFLPLIAAADVIVGYNVAFDLDMLAAELSRAKLPPLDLSGKQVVDVLRLWHHVEPRTLVAAHEKFCGQSLVDAHQAEADVAATARVLHAMLGTFGLTDKPWPEIAAIANPFSGRSAWIGPSMHVQWDEAGIAIFGFGKYKGHRVDKVDRGFLRWILERDFPPHVKDICRVALERKHQLAQWLAQYYPRQMSLPMQEPMQETADASQSEAP